MKYNPPVSLIHQVEVATAEGLHLLSTQASPFDEELLLNLVGDAFGGTLPFGNAYGEREPLRGMRSRSVSYSGGEP